jgi:hypothetical protein
MVFNLCTLYLNPKSSPNDLNYCFDSNAPKTSPKQSHTGSLRNLALSSTRAIRTGTCTLLPRQPITSVAVPYVGTRHTSGTDVIRSKSQLCKYLCSKDTDNDETANQDERITNRKMRIIRNASRRKQSKRRNKI